MLAKKIKYVDYDENEREETFYFNLNKAELQEMNLTTEGGMNNYIRRIVAAQDHKSLIKLFKEVILKSYGEKSLDGKRFVKSEQLTTEFTQTEAYVNLFMELSTNAEAAADFIRKVIPADIASELPENPQLPD